MPHVIVVVKVNYITKLLGNRRDGNNEVRAVLYAHIQQAMFVPCLVSELTLEQSHLTVGEKTAHIEYMHT